MKKKIIIFNSTGGGGHISVTKALESYLAAEYTIESVPILQELLQPVDPVYMITLGNYKGEDAYNYFIQNKAYRFLNFSSVFAAWYFGICRNKMEQLCLHYLKKKQPDLVISVAPFFNRAILTAAQTLDIPFLLIPTDLDTTTFLHGIEKVNYKKFRIALAFEDNEIVDKVTTIVDAKQIVITGFPLRSNFFEVNSDSNFKKKYNLPEDKPIILILMGLQGSTSLYVFAQQLKKLSIPAHFVFCLGKNEKIRKKIETLIFPSHLSRSIISYTPNIAALMSSSDLIITKSGSVSFCEALYTKKPIILDGTSNILKWEQFNHHFVTKYCHGISIKKKSELALAVKQFLENTNLLNSCPKLNFINASEKVKNLVKELIAYN